MATTIDKDEEDRKGLLQVQIDEDFDLDDIADLPESTIPPSGAYTIELVDGIVTREINDNDYWVASMTILECSEVPARSLREGEELPTLGNTVDILFWRGHERGAFQFKKFARTIAEHFKFTGKGTVGRVIEASKGLKMLVVFQRTYSKKNDRDYVAIRASTVL